YADGAPVDEVQSTLPPREITSEAMAQATEDKPPEAMMELATLGAHYGYGASVGSLYPLLGPHFEKSPALSGALFGLEVWLASYLGLLPALNSGARATSQPPRVNGVMI